MILKSSPGEHEPTTGKKIICALFNQKKKIIQCFQK